ncbi:5-hydroxytryptamine receptor 3A isoform 1-T1 [Hipposideros larvatus]
MLLWVPQALLAWLLPTLLTQGEARHRGSFQAHNTSRPALGRLSDYLLTNYKKGVRPVRDWRKPTTVAIDVIVYAILSVDEKNQVLTTYIWYRQYWTDEFLQWNPEDFDNITKLSIPTDSIWVPDILINEFVDVGKSPDIPYVYVRHHGEVQNYKPLQVVTACSLDIYNFPFDVQNCSLTFTSWLHTIQDINISLWRLPEKVKFDKSVFMNQGEWELLGVLTQFREFSIESSSCYAEMKFYVVIRRRPLFYAVSLLLPSIFLMVMDIVGFYLPPDSGERVSFKITLLLGYSVFLIIVSDTLPATAIGTPLIGVYFVVCMALLVISLAETIFICVGCCRSWPPSGTSWRDGRRVERWPGTGCVWAPCWTGCFSASTCWRCWPTASPWSLSGPSGSIPDGYGPAVGRCWLEWDGRTSASRGCQGCSQDTHTVPFPFPMPIRLCSPKPGPQLFPPKLDVQDPYILPLPHLPIMALKHVVLDQEKPVHPLTSLYISMHQASVSPGTPP